MVKIAGGFLAIIVFAVGVPTAMAALSKEQHLAILKDLSNDAEGYSREEVSSYLDSGITSSDYEIRHAALTVAMFISYSKLAGGKEAEEVEMLRDPYAQNAVVEAVLSGDVKLAGPAFVVLAWLYNGEPEIEATFIKAFEMYPQHEEELRRRLERLRPDLMEEVDRIVASGEATRALFSPNSSLDRPVSTQNNADGREAAEAVPGEEDSDTDNTLLIAMAGVAVLLGGGLIYMLRRGGHSNLSEN